MKLTLQVLQAFSDALYVSPAVYSAGTFLRFQPNLILVQLIQKTRQFYKWRIFPLEVKNGLAFWNNQWEKIGLLNFCSEGRKTFTFITSRIARKWIPTDR